MRKNLLRIVQTYLDYVDGFQVDSIFDSDEALQAATIAEHVYYTILDKNRDGIPTQRKTIRLQGGNSPSTPNILNLPNAVVRIHEAQVYYNGRLIKYLHPNVFLERYTLPQESDRTQQVVINNATFYIDKKKEPDFFTSFNDTTLVFDSYNEDEDTTLQSSKSNAIVTDHPVFLIQDNFVIPLPDHMHSGYQDVVIQECCEALRDIQKPQVARRANAFLSKLQKTSNKVGDGTHSRRRYGRR